MPQNGRQVDFGRLVDWLEGRLSADEARAVEKAVDAADGEALADVAWLQRFFRATGEALESPPPELRGSLVEVFEAHARSRQAPGILRRVIAGLAFDSNLQPAVGLRAVGGQQARRQLIYHADEFDLALNLLSRDADNDLDIDGQMLPHQDGEIEPFSVQLLHDGSEAALTVTDELGSFAFRGVVPGAYELVFVADGVEIAVSPIDAAL